MSFSILERIVVGETPTPRSRSLEMRAFSILERIVVGETGGGVAVLPHFVRLSVSSNGSLWVKLLDRFSVRRAAMPFSILERIVVGETRLEARLRRHLLAFQYPRTDRCG